MLAILAEVYSDEPAALRRLELERFDLRSGQSLTRRVIEFSQRLGPD